MKRKKRKRLIVFSAADLVQRTLATFCKKEKECRVLSQLHGSDLLGLL